VLRSLEEPYGITGLQPALTPEEQKDLRLGTYLVQRTSLLARAAAAVGAGSAIENPAPTPGRASIFYIKGYEDLKKATGSKEVDFDQCPLGAETAKPTKVAYFYPEARPWRQEAMGRAGFQ